jgi:uncharacterized protein (DUF1810 family)
VSEDRFDLQRFVDAQDRGGSYATALAELRTGAKQGHWIWFVFPQLAGLGSSPMSQRYAIGSVREARAYLEHELLGPRLIDCSETLLELPGADPKAVLGEIDARKLRSSMTLFAGVPRAPAVFARVLERYYDGSADPATEDLLAGLNQQP